MEKSTEEERVNPGGAARKKMLPGVFEVLRELDGEESEVEILLTLLLVLSDAQKEELVQAGLANWGRKRKSGRRHWRILNGVQLVRTAAYLREQGCSGG